MLGPTTYLTSNEWIQIGQTSMAMCQQSEVTEAKTTHIEDARRATSFLQAALTTSWQAHESRLFSHTQCKLSMCMAQQNVKPTHVHLTLPVMIKYVPSVVSL